MDLSCLEGPTSIPLAKYATLMVVPFRVVDQTSVGRFQERVALFEGV